MLDGARYRLLPEWSYGGQVVLPWLRTRERVSCLPIIEQLYQALCPFVGVRVVSDRDPDGEDPAWARELQRIGRWHVLGSMRDIWIRDWAPLVVESSGGSLVAVKPIYRPRYSPEMAAFDDRAGAELARALGLALRPLNLIWDLGNLTHNRAGIAVATRQLLEDNRECSESELRESLRRELGIEHLVLVPWEPYDVVRHVDGIARFVAEDKILVGSYPPEYSVARFMDRLAARLRRALKPHVEVLRISNAMPSDRSREGIPSAEGNYVNFLRSGDLVCLPQYGLPEDDLAFTDLTAALPQCKIIRAQANALADLGGVFNCISWNLPAAPGTSQELK